VLESMLAFEHCSEGLLQRKSMPRPLSDELQGLEAVEVRRAALHRTSCLDAEERLRKGRHWLTDAAGIPFTSSELLALSDQSCSQQGRVMQHRNCGNWTWFGISLALLLVWPAMAVGAEVERINPAGVYKHPNFTRVITVKSPGKMIFIAGQTPSDMEYKCVAPGDFKGQFIQVMDNLKKGLEAAGATFDDVVHRRTYVLDMDKYLAAMRDPEIPRYWNREKPPASTTVQVSRLSDPCFLIEIDLLAVRD
jgi:enamine deaminase RidA (YjgF/YER057c/UK114 family)